MFCGKKRGKRAKATDMMGACSSRSPLEESPGAVAAQRAAPVGHNSPVAQSPLRVTKALFMSSDSDDSDASGASSSRRAARKSSAGDAHDKENAGGAFRHRQRRDGRRSDYAQSPVRRRHARSPSRERKREHEAPSACEKQSRTPVNTRTKNRRRSPPWNSPSVVLTSKLGVKLSVRSPSTALVNSPVSTTPARAELLKTKILLQLIVPSTLSPCASSIDEFAVMGLLGSGVSSEVFKVRLDQDNVLYAVKKSKDEMRSSRERSVRQREIEIVSKCTSSSSDFEHIVRHYQAWQENGYFYLLLEFCEGGTLKDFLAAQNEQVDLPEAILWYILEHVASGLAVVHSHGIVHLDIKPENIFIAQTGELKIGDFGMAVHSTHETSSSDEQEGDATYMAPELLSNSSRQAPSDIFCLGISLLQVALKLTLPTDGDEWHSLRQGYLPAFPTTYTSILQQLIAQMMHPDPSKRPTAAEIVSLAKSSRDHLAGAATFKEFVRVRSATAAATPKTRNSTRRSLDMNARTPRKCRTSEP